jgi:anti-anti-sigma factor
MSASTTASIRMPARVTFANGSEFRKQLFAAMGEQIKHLTIDLSDTQFMDSAGLGMLLVASKECQAIGASLTLLRPQGDVKKLLELTRSNERFQITY